MTTHLKKKLQARRLGTHTQLNTFGVESSRGSYRGQSGLWLVKTMSPILPFRHPFQSPTKTNKRNNKQVVVNLIKTTLFLSFDKVGVFFFSQKECFSLFLPFHVIIILPVFFTLLLCIKNYSPHPFCTVQFSTIRLVLAWLTISYISFHY